MKLLVWYLSHFSRGELFQLYKTIERMIVKKMPYSARVKFAFNKNSHPRIRVRLLSPIKPSVGDIQIYKNYFQKTKSIANILILGSTPELRDLVASSGYENYIVADFSYLMIERNLKLCKKADLDKEIWIKSNWLSLPFPSGFFDVILGDLVIDQFLPSEQSVFLEKIQQLLKPNGRFITKNHIANTKLFSSYPREVIEDTLNDSSKKDERQIAFTLVSSRLRDCLRSDENKTTNPTKILEELRTYFPRNEREDTIIKNAIAIASYRERININYITQTEDEINLLFKSFFTHVEKHSATDYEDATFFPIYSSKL